MEQIEQIDRLILDKTTEKYRLVGLAARWAQELKTRHNLPEPVQHLIPKALREILDGTVSIDTIEQLFDKPSQPVTDTEETPLAIQQKDKTDEEEEKEEKTDEKKPAKAKAKTKKTSKK